MLTIIGPLIVIGLVANEYAALVIDPAGAFGQSVATLVTLVLMVSSVGYGIYAGLQLWLIRPDAVRTAKRALLLGLAVDIVTATFASTFGPGSSADGQLLNPIFVQLIPSLVFFTLCFAYLNRSSRVDATYRASIAD
jgi:hypothetical protein